MCPKHFVSSFTNLQHLRVATAHREADGGEYHPVLLPRRLTATPIWYSEAHEIPHCVRNDEGELGYDARGRQCRQAMQTRRCGFSRFARNRPADLTFLLLFWSIKKVKEENMNGRLYDPVRTSGDVARNISTIKFV